MLTYMRVHVGRMQGSEVEKDRQDKFDVYVDIYARICRQICTYILTYVHVYNIDDIYPHI